MNIKNLSQNVEEFTANVYLVEKNILVDVGKGEEVRNKISELENIEKVLITHSHYDHVDNLQYVIEEYDPEVYAYAQSINGVRLNRLKDKDIIEISEDFVFEVLHTPGHKDDHLCFYNRKQDVLFCGDLIFANGSFGRTDLAEGDRNKLIRSIKKIMNNCEVKSFYAGHDKPVLEDGDKSIRESLENAEKREKKYE